MMGCRVATVAAWVAVVLALPGQAGAKRHIAPPGNAGVQQYLETVPSARGNSQPQWNKPNPQAVPAPVRRQLEQRGEPGRALEKLVAATSPRPKPRPLPELHLPAVVTPRLVASSSHDTGGGTGPFLPLALAGSTLVLVGL